MMLALGVDLLWGEPPARLHPVVWMGRYLAWMKRKRPAGRTRAFLAGAGLLLLGAGLFAGLALVIVWLLRGLPWWSELFLLALMLKPTLSVRALVAAGGEVKAALEAQNLPEARRLVGWHLVSRDTSQLTEAEVAGAAVESLAENVCDSIVAPLCYFALLGLPGAVLYRFVNTADAVIGYRTPEFEDFGKAAARCDDLLNFLPARITALLLCLALWLLRFDAPSAWRTMLRDGHATPSPNAGLAMAAVAGGLGMRLDKRGVYVLNPSGRPADAAAIGAAQRLVLVATGLALLVAVSLLLFRGYVHA
jgi:adenosylcobinamide-phosphate synthase